MRLIGLSSEPTPCRAPFTFGCLYLWKNSPPSPSRPTPPPPVSAELAARTHQSPHARGMTSCALAGLSKQGQGVFFRGLTEINRTALGSIFLRENLVFIKDYDPDSCPQLLAPALCFFFPTYLVACHSFSSATNFLLPRSSCLCHKSE
ncbi:hypothetical protein PBY51_015677 [Eleginops maclovinus]|uniref:Uncharacterized protein n=1 Tax=Eleginops maclovinus TaxID=56733 RepID=A0AAN7XPM5_ELEMC|nr:hypothetical protein PBY51_015677 [Eleginops maclovinus]